MGEVYLTEDSKLGRKVALKLLPASFIKDEERVRRFAQEGRAASALNHPNIALFMRSMKQMASTSSPLSTSKERHFASISPMDACK